MLSPYVISVSTVSSSLPPAFIQKRGDEIKVQISGKYASP